jgi:hypothetical protein
MAEPLQYSPVCPYCGHTTLYKPEGWTWGGPLVCANPLCPSNEPHARVIFGAQAARCICVKDPGHEDTGDEVHACDPETCGGSWSGTYDQDSFEVHSFPKDPLS